MTTSEYPARILVENGAYDVANLGDAAMLQVAIARLEEVFPRGQIYVLTSSPERLAQIAPRAIPYPASSRWMWCNERLGTRRLARFGLMRWLNPPRRKSEAYLRWPMMWDCAHRASGRLLEADRETARSFEKFLESMDIVVAAGFGNIADAFSDLARDEVLMFRASARLGKPFVLFSQGLGPVEDQHFLRILSRVLPKADLIAVREAGGSLRLAQQLGVPEDRITVTGDDALEVAYGAPRGRSATRIGVNIRVTDYAGVDIEVSRRIGSIIAEVASDLSVPCIGLPIRLASDGPGHLDDAEALRKMFDSSPEVCPTSSPVATPSGLASLVSDCRLVVAGSYHAAVFALGQGVPAIGLFKSRYYGEKFGGLKSQFKAGCYLVDLNDHDWEISLRSTIVTVYKKAERLRPILRARAVSQIAASRNAYSRLATLLPQGVGRV